MMTQKQSKCHTKCVNCFTSLPDSASFMYCEIRIMLARSQSHIYSFINPSASETRQLISGYMVLTQYTIVLPSFSFWFIYMAFVLILHNLTVLVLSVHRNAIYYYFFFLFQLVVKTSNSIL